MKRFLLFLFPVAAMQAQPIIIFEDNFDYPIGRPLPAIYFSVRDSGEALVTRGLTFPGYEMVGGSVTFDSPSLEMETEMDWGIPITKAENGFTRFYVGLFVELETPGGFGSGMTGVSIFNEADPGKEGFITGVLSSGTGTTRMERFAIGVGARPTDAAASESFASVGDLVAEEKKTYFLLARFEADFNNLVGGLRGALRVYEPGDPLPRAIPETWGVTIVRDKGWPLTERNKVLNRVELFRGNTASRVALAELRIVGTF